MTKDGSDLYLNKITCSTSIRNSWTSKSFNKGLSNGFISIGGEMGEFFISAGTPFLYYVGKLKNYANSGLIKDYPNDTGYLMKMTTVEGISYNTETCTQFTVTYSND
jgi:hypothetical protein